MSAVTLHGVGKTYAQYARVVDRLLEVLTGRHQHREFVALHPVELTVARGEVLGLIGMNGAGKSTLLKLIAGTILPSSGKVRIEGRVSALLELGAGFHPEMTGRENVYLSATVQGITTAQIDTLYSEIVQFAGIADFMEQPVKTYSSGMFVRLAFAVATCIQPDILIVDEALSVGDGAFALKSFKRIMDFKDAGGTILFCSHSLYQVEAICSRVLWVHKGRILLDGKPTNVTAAYNHFLESGLMPGESPLAPIIQAAVPTVSDGRANGVARLSSVEISVAGGVSARELSLECGKDDLTVRTCFISDPELPAPTIAVVLVRADGCVIASVGSFNDGLDLQRQVDGSGAVTLTFPRLPLLKGEYWVTVYLACERALHEYDQAAMVARVRVTQRGLEQGIVSLPHTWRVSRDAG